MSRFYNFRATRNQILKALSNKTMTEIELVDALYPITKVEAANPLGYTNFLGLKDNDDFLKNRPDCRRQGSKRKADFKEFPLQWLINEGKVVYLPCSENQPKGKAWGFKTA